MCLSLCPAPWGRGFDVNIWRVYVALELHLRHLADHLALATEVEELLRREAERAREQGGRELLDAGVVLLHRIIEEAPRGGELVFEVAELGLQLLEIGVGLEVRVGLAERDQPPKRA